ncbi:protein of unknown function, partial [Arthrobacter sp. 31Cvi3.1E]
MEALGQLTAARVASSPAVAALTASCSRQSPGNFQWIKGSTAVATAIGHFHGVGLLSREGTTSRGSDGGRLAAPAGPDLAALLEDGQALLDTARLSFAEQAPLFDLAQAADLAGRIEDLSRSIEYLQVVAAQAVERTRTEAQRAAPAQQTGQSPASGAQEWRTGWTEPAGESEGGVGGGSVPAAADDGAGAGAGGSVLDDGYRNAAEFLRARLRIGIGEARRRLALATEVLPGAGMTGQEIPARRQRLADALHTGQVPSRSATIISTALDKAQHFTDPDTLTGMEHALTTTATQSDPDFVTTMANRWIDHIDHNGPEPTEEALRHVQGAFLRR